MIPLNEVNESINLKNSLCMNKKSNAKWRDIEGTGRHSFGSKKNHSFNCEDFDEYLIQTNPAMEYKSTKYPSNPGLKAFIILWAENEPSPQRLNLPMWRNMQHEISTVRNASEALPRQFIDSIYQRVYIGCLSYDCRGERALRNIFFAQTI